MMLIVLLFYFSDCSITLDPTISPCRKLSFPLRFNTDHVNVEIKLSVVVNTLRMGFQFEFEFNVGLSEIH